MARNKTPQDIRRRREQRKPQKKRKVSRLKHGWWKTPLQSFTVLSAIAGVLTLIPRIELLVAGSLDPTAPMRTVFSIENQSLLPIHDIDAVCANVEVANRFAGGISGVSFRLPESHADTLSPGQQMSLPCNRVVDMGPTGTEKAKMTIRISYRPDWVWWHRHVEFPVEAERAKDGTWIWKRLPH